MPLERRIIALLVVIGVGLGVAIAGLPSRHKDAPFHVASGPTTSTTGPSTTVTTTASTIATTTAPPPVTYQVKNGDNLSRIASKFNVSVAAIVAANKLSSDNAISTGDTLVIPPAGQ